jgi:hypothetical protein
MVMFAHPCLSKAKDAKGWRHLSGDRMPRGVRLVYRLNGENIDRNYHAALCRNRRSSVASLRGSRDNARNAKVVLADDGSHRIIECALLTGT